MKHRFLFTLALAVFFLALSPSTQACCPGDPVCDGSCETDFFGFEFCDGSCRLEEGDSCGLGTSNALNSCGFGTECSVPLGVGECVDKNACRTEGQGCDVLGINTCCGGLGCNLLGVCVDRKGAGESCIPLNNDCDDGLECDGSSLKCAHSPRKEGEGCGIADPCEGHLFCDIDSICKEKKGAKEACNPLNIVNECESNLVCDIYGECRHNPPEEGEFCDKTIPILPKCSSDTFCDGLRCQERKGVGQTCTISSECKDDLDCTLDSEFVFRCFPESTQVLDEDSCVAFHDEGFHEGVIGGNDAVTFGFGSQAAVGISASDQIGVAYGTEGEYGCYFTHCVGGTSNIGIQNFVSSGQYISYEAIRGGGTSIVEEGGISFVSIALSQEFDDSGIYEGFAEAVSVGIDLLPVSVGVYACSTILDTFMKKIGGEYYVLSSLSTDSSGNPTARTRSGKVKTLSASEAAQIESFNEPPVAVCNDTVVCYGADCQADTTIDGGSYDPNGDSITITYNQTGPYVSGLHEIELTVTDAKGKSDNCTGTLTVQDCFAPTITCPDDIIEESEKPKGNRIDLDAQVNDICEPSPRVSTNGDDRYEVGEHTVTMTATDLAGNTADCTVDIEITDTTDPKLRCPADVFTGATSPFGARVPLTPTVSDNGDSSPKISSSGISFYPIGRNHCHFSS